MAQLSDSDIRTIVEKASHLQKYADKKPGDPSLTSNDQLKKLYEITDEMGLPRPYVYEAYTQQMGIPVQEPLVIDNHDFSSTKVVGFARGTFDSGLISELKSQIEYHFNSVGKISHRRDKIIWKAKPSGISKILASANSPEVLFEQMDGSTKITVSQSLKTHNKFYLPALLSGFGGFMLFAAVLFGETGDEVAPPLLVSALILLGTAFYARFINRRKKKKKQNLQELTETLQGKIERHLKATVESPNSASTDTSEIEIPENEYAGEEVQFSKKNKAKE